MRGELPLQVCVWPRLHLHGSFHNCQHNACRIGASNLLLEYTLSAAAVARSFTSYTGALISGNADLLRIPTGSKYFLIDFPALGITAALCALLAFGTQGGVRFNTAVTILNLVVIAFVLAAGVPHFDSDNFKPFLPLGVHGIFSGASKVCLAKCTVSINRTRYQIHA